MSPTAVPGGGVKRLHFVPSLKYKPGDTSPVVAVLYVIIPVTCADSGAKLLKPVKEVRVIRNPFAGKSISRPAEVLAGFRVALMATSWEKPDKEITIKVIKH